MNVAEVLQMSGARSVICCAVSHFPSYATPRMERGKQIPTRGSRQRAFPAHFEAMAMAAGLTGPDPFSTPSLLVLKEGENLSV